MTCCRSKAPLKVKTVGWKKKIPVKAQKATNHLSFEQMASYSVAKIRQENVTFATSIRRFQL